MNSLCCDMMKARDMSHNVAALPENSTCVERPVELEIEKQTKGSHCHLRVTKRSKLALTSKEEGWLFATVFTATESTTPHSGESF